MKLATSILLLALLGCSRQVLAPLEPADEFERAMEFYKNRRYDQAVLAFERVIFYHAVSEYVDDAQFYLGRTYFEKKDYAQAIAEFDYLIRNLPNSPFLEESYLYRAKSYLARAPSYEKDQTETKEAINYFEEFLTRFPNSRFAGEAKNLILSARNRLARKELENGKLYIKLKEFDAAIYYFKYVIENYPETASANEARYNLALSYEKKGKPGQALQLYKELLAEETWQKKVEKRIKEIEKR